MSTAQVADDNVQIIRGFNRFYTKQIGLLNRHVYRSSFSLAEVRVLYELAHRSQPTAAELGKELGLDAGYLSRILHRFQKQGLITRTASDNDGRRSFLSLSANGHKAFSALDRQSSEEISAILSPIADVDRNRLARAMREIQQLLEGRSAGEGPYLLRAHKPGDMGWVVYRHGALYSQEYGWDERFEALVAEIAAKFVQNFDSKRERCWIAEKDGEIIGSVFLVKDSEETARLRLLLVEPKARGLGLGKRLVQECIDFARQAGYKKITLWTQSVLLAARRIYERAGFVRVHEEAHNEFGYPLISETWELKL